MKTILLSLPYGMSARNMLRSGVYKVLRDQVKLVILTPLADNPDFQKEFAHPQATFVTVPRQRSLPQNLLKQLLFTVETYWFTQAHPVETLVMLKNQLKRENPLRYAVCVGYAQTLGRFAWYRKTLESLYHSTLRYDWLERVFDDHRIDLVFLTHGYMQEETAVALVAKRRHIPVVGMIHSWDNLTSKTGLRQITNVNPGRKYPAEFVNWFVVWNSILEEEFMQLYSIPKEKIFKSGIPQFDSYVGYKPRRSRDEFITSMGGDPKRKLLYFIATSTQVIHDQTRALRALIDAVRNNTLAEPSQVLVRFHPGADMSSWKKVFAGPHVFFQEPGAAFQALAVAKEWRADDHSTLPESICHCDVLINGISTTAIEGAIFDKPIVCFAFDGDLERNRHMADYCSNTHYKKLLAMGGIQLAWNETDLINEINIYLKNPAQDAKGRQTIREKQCHILDGKAGERVGQFLLEQLSLKQLPRT